MDTTNSLSAKLSTKHVLTCLVFGLLGTLAYALAPNDPMVVWYSVLPPILAVSLVIITNRLLSSMITGVIVGGVLAAFFHEAPLLSGLTRVAGYFSSSLSDSWNLQILIFIPIMMSMVAIMITSGGIQAVIERLMKFSSTRRSTQVTTIMAGFLLFFDDYANTMVVGSGMRPITDGQKISRAKLAFLVDATSAPIAGLALISTWVGYEIGLFNGVSTDLALGQDGFGMFLDALGYRYYCIMMIIFIFVNTLSGRDFGPMLKAEIKSLSSDKTHNSDLRHNAQDIPSAKPYDQARQRLISCLIPLGGLFVVLLGGFWLDGGGGDLFANDPWSLLSLSAWQATIIKVKNSVTVLVYAASTGFVLAVATALLVGRVPFTALIKSIRSTLEFCITPICILIFAWVLKGVCDDLGTGKFLVATIGTSVSPLIFPAIVFVLAAMTAFATGTSWGTMAILIPTVIPIAFQLDNGVYGLSTIICLGAVLDGSIFGDHCSPISDTTILSSAASSCNHMEHVRTQLPYALLVATMAIVLGYIPAAMGASTWQSLALSTVAIFAVFGFLGKDPAKAEQVVEIQADPVMEVVT